MDYAWRTLVLHRTIKEKTMTKILYDDPYLTEFDSTITEISNTGSEIILAETVFYPTGGGQKCDTGELQINGTVYKVTEVKKIGLTIYHKIEGAFPTELSSGTPVHGKIDEIRRKYHTVHHTSLHLLNVFMLKEFGVLVTGAQVGTPGESSRMDFNMDRSLTQDERKRLEEWVNLVISDDMPVIVRYATDEDANAIPYLRRTLNKDIPRTNGKIRVVEITGIDAQACGGTHVKHTGEIGRFRIQKIDNKGVNNRRINVLID